MISCARVAHPHLVISKINVIIIIIIIIIIIMIIMNLLPYGRKGGKGVGADEGAVEEGDRKEQD